MIRFAVNRLGQMLPTILIISMLVFAMSLILPGDAAMAYLGMFGEDADDRLVTPEAYQAMRERLGLDDPIPVQYWNWVSNAALGDLGWSALHKRPVLDIIATRLPATLYLGVAAFAVGLMIAIPLGVWSAIRSNTIVDHISNGIVLFGLAVPNFTVALLLMLGVSVHLGLLPATGYAAPQEDFGQFLKHIALPATVMGVDLSANILRYVRSDFLGQLHQDYVRTARGKGLPERVIMLKHILKNSMISTVTIVGLELPRVLGGSTIVETMFSYPGISHLLLQSIYNRDFPVVQAVTLVIALLAVGGNFFADFFYMLLDPRVRARRT